MKKREMKPGTLLAPLPAVLVTSSDGTEDNVLTIAWTGIINSEPPMTYVSVTKKRYSHHIIEKSGEFVINLVNEDLARAADFCGVRSGRNMDKFAECSLTKAKASTVGAPLIAESPVNIECKVKEIHEYGSHDMFVAEITTVNAAEELFDEAGRLCLDKAGLICFSHGEYFALKSKPLGRFGHSVMKPKTRKRINKENNEKKRMAKSSKKLGK